MNESSEVQGSISDLGGMTLRHSDAQLLAPDTDVTTFLQYMAKYDINTAQAVAFIGLLLASNSFDLLALFL